MDDEETRNSRRRDCSATSCESFRSGRGNQEASLENEKIPSSSLSRAQVPREIGTLEGCVGGRGSCFHYIAGLARNAFLAEVTIATNPMALYPGRNGRCYLYQSWWRRGGEGMGARASSEETHCCIRNKPSGIFFGMPDRRQQWIAFAGILSLFLGWRRETRGRVGELSL